MPDGGLIVDSCVVISTVWKVEGHWTGALADRDKIVLEVSVFNDVLG